MSVVRRVTGMGIAGSLALALLAGGCVLAATAGPRQAQATAMRELRQTMDGVSPLEKTIVASTDMGTVYSDLDAFLTQANLNDVTTQLRGDVGTGPLSLAPQSADWAGMSSGESSVASALPALNQVPADIAVAYRYPLAGHLRLVAGTMPDIVPPTEAATPANPLLVVVTQQTARRFGLRLGSRVASGGIYLDVTGIVEPTDPGSAFWVADPLLAAPALTYVGESKLWEGEFIADPGELANIQDIFGPSSGGLSIRWVLPVDTTLDGQATALFKQLNQVTSQTPQLTGYVAPLSNALTVSSGLVQPLATLVQDSNAVNVLLWMVYVSLAVAGIVMLLLAARTIAARRSVELTMLRGRGASLWQLFWAGSLGAAVACVPAAALAWAAAVLLVPGAAPAGSAAWWPGAATLAIAVAIPGAAAAWPYRLPRRRQVRSRGRWARRLVFEAAACAAAVGGITIFRMQAGVTDLYTSAAPVLVAVPAVIVVLRLYQVLLRGLARISARQRGVIGFLGLTRAAQATATLALPAMTLVLALTVAAFTGMVRDAVVRGDNAASWQATGADVDVAAPGLLLSINSVISPSAVRAIAAVPGVQHAATALTLPVATTSGGEVMVIVVDPASYAALVASTEGFSPVHPALLTQPHGQDVIPVLASPQAAADLREPQGSTIAAQDGLPTLHVRVAGELQSTPALPAGGAFIVLPLSAVHGVSGPLPVNLMLLTGPSIDMTRFHAVVGATMPGAEAPALTTRSLVLQGLTAAPLQQGTFLLFSLAIGCAAALALAVMLLELALGTADRELTMARLATMGLTERQRAGLAALEVIPAVAASAVAVVACAVILPGLVSPAIDLSAFTQSQAAVPLRPDLASFVLPLAGLVIVTVITLAYEIRLVRGPGVAVTMRGS
jgi:putative ABC transport system permease protein